MNKSAIATTKAPGAIGPYSQGITIGACIHFWSASNKR